MFKAACCIAASILLFLPVAFWLYSSAPVNSAEQAAVADRFVMPEYCRPEPGERLVYLAGIVFLPLALLGLTLAWRRWGSRLPPLPASVVLAFEVVFALGLTVAVWLALLGNEYYHLRSNRFFLYPLLAVPFLPAALLAMRWDLGAKRLVRPLLHLVALGLAGVIFLGSVYNDKGASSGDLHFNAVFFPVVQVYEGKALLIDCASQYGLYPQLLRPLFALTGLTVLGFTLVMGLLNAGSFVALWAFLKRACENKSAAFVGFAALLFNTWFFFARESHFRPYFQYYPIRLVFPAFLALLAWQHLHQPTRRLYWGLLVFLAVGVLWNLDAGLPSLLAWTLTLCFAELFGDDWRCAVRRIAGHTAASGCVLAVVAALYSTVVRLRYGSFPDYGQFFHYQQLYFAAGYNKLPMNPPTTWLLVGLVYLAGLAYAAFALAARQGTARAKIVFLLSVLGVGLSSYFQGRSHPNVLVLVWWPCQLLLVLFLDDLLLKLKEKPARLLPWFATAVLSWFLVGSAYSLTPELPSVAKAVAANYRVMFDSKVPPRQQEESALLARLVPPGEKTVVAAPSSALIHLASKRPAVTSSPLPGQMILMDEYRQLDELLDHSPSTLVLMDKFTFAPAGWQAKDRGSRALVALLQKSYEIAAATQSSYLFVRRSECERLFDEEEATMLHVAVRNGAPVAGLTFAPLSTKPPWSLEMVVKPAAAQGPNAALVGNHPGRGAGGFVVQQEAPGVLALVAGDGKAWRRVLQFGLRSGQWNYLTLVRSQDAFTVYLDGLPIVSQAASDLQMEDSPLPLQVGNWIGNDRPFNGEVKEVRVLNRALAAGEVAAKAAHVRAKLP